MVSNRRIITTKSAETGTRNWSLILMVSKSFTCIRYRNIYLSLSLVIAVTILFRVRQKIKKSGRVGTVSYKSNRVDRIIQR